MSICVTGTPGVGKTFLAKKLAKKLRLKYIDVNKVVKDYKLSIGYDKKRKSMIVDAEKLSKLLVKIIKKNKKVIIDGHLSHYLPRTYVDLCIVVKCDLKTLKTRLKKRGYSKEKIRENLDAEIFEICLQEAKENSHDIIVIDGGKSFNLNKIIKKIK